MFKCEFKAGALSSAQFRWFYLGRSVSLFGSAMTPVALAFAVLQAPKGQQLLGYILAAEILPNVLMLLIGGTIADRYRRDRLLLFSNVGSGVSQACIAVIILLGVNPYWIFPLAIVNGVLAAFTSPSMRGIIPEIVHSQGAIREANSLLNTSRSAAKIVGPTVAGVLVATVGGGWGIAIDSCSFFIAAVCLIRVRIPSHPRTSSSLVQDMRDGWSYFRHRRWIWSITGAFAVINLIQMGVWQVLGPIIAKNTFGSAGWGLTLGIRAVGLLLASLAMLRFRMRRPLRDSMTAIAISGIPLIVLGQGYALPFLMIAALFAGAGSTISGIGWDTFLQQAIPKDKLSRVCAFDDFGAYVTIPIGEILAVPLAGAFGYRAVATVGGLVFIVAALLPLSQRLVRRMTPDDVQTLELYE